MFEPLSAQTATAALDCYIAELPFDCVVLTPNLRLMRVLRAAQMRAEPLPQQLRIEAFSSWWLDLFNAWQGQHLPPLTLLGPSAMRELWRHAVRQVSGERDWLIADGLTDLAYGTWNDLRTHLRRREDLEHSASEPRWLGECVDHVNARLEALHAVDAVGGLQRVIGVLRDPAARADVLRSDALPAHMVLTGFDVMTPLELALCRQLREAGVLLSSRRLRLRGSVQRVGCTDATGEWRAAARWALAHLRASSASTIAVVIPSLATDRAKIERVFTEVFHPHAHALGQPRMPPGFNISAAEPLQTTPPIAAALKLLALNTPSLLATDVAAILHSPFWGEPSEQPLRAVLADRLSEHYVSLTPRQLRTEVLEAAAAAAGRMDRTRTQIVEFFNLALQTERGTLDHWAELFARQLQALGLSGTDGGHTSCGHTGCGRTLDSLEYQQLREWSRVLSDLSAASNYAPACSAAAALAHLRRLAARPFQAQTQNSPLQILGTLEGAGQIFDKLWVCGLDDRQWPEPVRINPLLPADLQRHWQLPRTSADNELSRAERLLDQFAEAAREVVFSWPERAEDAALGPTQLIAHWPQVALCDLPLAQVAPHWDHFGSAALLAQVQTHAPLGAQGARSGGSGLLKDQAACAFRGFARHRLQADDPRVCEPGINALQRGNLVHGALEWIWTQLKDQANLRALDESQRAELIGAALDWALENLEGRHRIGAQQLAIERRRGVRLLQDWLTIEAARPPFTVLAQEAKVQVAVGPLELTVRFDRMDRLADGSVVVIDYKTGATKLTHWCGERPEEPQVPLYALAAADSGASVSGAAFAEIRAQGVAARGLCATVAHWPSLPPRHHALKLPEHWPDVLEHWRRALVNLAADYAAGDARVAPKNPAETCKFCNLQRLCRRAEALSGGGATP